MTTVKGKERPVVKYEDDSPPYLLCKRFKSRFFKLPFKIFKPRRTLLLSTLTSMANPTLVHIGHVELEDS